MQFPVRADEPFRAEQDDSGIRLESSISKFFSADCQKAIAEASQAGGGDLILIVADKPSVAANALGMLRLKIAEDQGMQEHEVLRWARKRDKDARIIEQFAGCVLIEVRDA